MVITWTSYPGACRVWFEFSTVMLTPPSVQVPSVWLVGVIPRAWQDSSLAGSLALTAEAP